MHTYFDMSSVKQTSSEKNKFKLSPMTSTSNMNKKSLGETFIVFISELTQTQNKDVQKIFEVPVSNTPAIQQEAEITQIVPETLFATAKLQEILDKIISRMMKIENNVSKMQTYVTT